ncbi:TIGR03862 family flavoprotein [Brytella acorum]|uniref:TIGR03862 family flavoprotein n=1 Tax=Brytella acorum TaxID=2959299 RepID=A0AA35XV79_9PROT|nr:TIGR03862 family flavoprotein [Brytella acorum]MDF3625593.1 TIGR03862 family flavoprotein [Brytella acorum]CAI9119460.1 TIGR03862 family flavoprotein [Brytella acorum]
MSHASTLSVTAPRIAVIGAGPAGLFAAEILSGAGLRVTVYDRMTHPARKFLMAGASGLNLTHAEPLETFLTRYGHARPSLEAAIRAFPPEALRAWAEALGQSCFTGSSGRVFPNAMKASPLLRAWLERLEKRGVTFAPRHRWTGWSRESPVFDTPEGRVSSRADATLLALGGASWSRLGSDGAWITLLPDSDIAPFAPSNCGFLPKWTREEFERWDGAVLSGIALRYGNRTHRGDLSFTRHGIEGAPIYALSGPIRDAIATQGGAIAFVDLRPGTTEPSLATRLGQMRPRESLANRLRKGAGLSPLARAILHEASRHESVPASDPGALAARIKNAPLRLTAPEAMDRAISVAGGLRFEALDQHFMLRNRPGVFAAGEMLDWEAPTGGYLLQGCFSTARAAANGLVAWLKAHPKG